MPENRWPPHESWCAAGGGSDASLRHWAGPMPAPAMPGEDQRRLVRVESQWPAEELADGCKLGRTGMGETHLGRKTFLPS
jgi:hypothetical protein